MYKLGWQDFLTLSCSDAMFMKFNIMVVSQCLEPHLPACTSLITLDSRLGGYAMLRVKPKWLLLAQFNYSNNSFAYIYNVSKLVTPIFLDYA